MLERDHRARENMENIVTRLRKTQIYKQKMEERETIDDIPTRMETIRSEPISDIPTRIETIHEPKVTSDPDPPPSDSSDSSSSDSEKKRKKLKDKKKRRKHRKLVRPVLE